MLALVIVLIVIYLLVVATLIVVNCLKLICILEDVWSNISVTAVRVTLNLLTEVAISGVAAFAITLAIYNTIA